MGAAPGRRGVVAGLAGLLARPCLSHAQAAVVPQHPPAGELTFRIMRKGERIGTHALRFQATGEALTVRVEVDILVRVLLVPVFRYRHRNVESWRSGQLMGFDAQTDHNGTEERASAERGGEGLVVRGTQATVDRQPGSYLAPPGSIGGTHWNRRELAAPIINPENGHLNRPLVRDAGLVQWPLADGSLVSARRYVLSGEVRLELFYTPDDQWTGLRFTADDGSAVSYEKL